VTPVPRRQCLQRTTANRTEQRLQGEVARLKEDKETLAETNGKLNRDLRRSDQEVNDMQMNLEQSTRTITNLQLGLLENDKHVSNLEQETRKQRRELRQYDMKMQRAASWSNEITLLLGGMPTDNSSTDRTPPSADTSTHDEEPRANDRDGSETLEMSNDAPQNREPVGDGTNAETPHDAATHQAESATASAGAAASAPHCPEHERAAPVSPAPAAAPAAASVGGAAPPTTAVTPQAEAVSEPAAANTMVTTDAATAPSEASAKPPETLPVPSGRAVEYTPPGGAAIGNLVWTTHR
jgi:FtsZ-binding cell division protein ZapB